MVFRRGGDIVSIIALKDRSRCQRGRFFILRSESAKRLKNLFRIGALRYVYRINILPVDLVGSFSP